MRVLEEAEYRFVEAVLVYKHSVFLLQEPFFL